jgi:PAS domain-containing protein
VSEKAALLTAKRPGGRANHRALTARQRQVLDLVVRGLGNKAIATELGVSEQAAKEHVSTLLRRFGATGRAALAEIGTQLRIVGTTDLDVSWLPYLFLAAPIGILVFRGPEHRVVAVNDTARRASDRDIVGLAFVDAFPHSAGQLLPLLDRVYSTGEPRSESEFGGIWVRDGVSQASYGDFVLQPIIEADGSVSGVMIFGSDVTERVMVRRRAEELRAEQLAIFDLMNDGVIVVDATGAIVKVNEAARQIAGVPLSFDQLVDDRIEPFRLRYGDGRPLDQADVPLLRALAGETVPWTDYIAFNAARRADVRLRVAAKPMRSPEGSIAGAVVVFRKVRQG